MQTIGLIGGMSWYSTLEYYRIINEETQRRRGGHASARIALQSLDFAEIRECQLTDDWARAGQLLAEAGRGCEAAGADLVLLCTNLMHRVAEDIQNAIDVPFLHIADAVADRAVQQGWERLGLLGTRWVMEEDFYVGRLGQRGLTVDVPGPEERLEVDRIVFEELTQGRVEPESRTTYLGVIERLAGKGAQAVVLGCTEIEALVTPDLTPLPLLDSTRTHAEAAVSAALGDRVLA